MLSQFYQSNPQLKTFIFPISDSLICPVKTFCLWQRPKSKNFNKFDKVWYNNIPIGRDPLNETMKNLSTNAKFSHIYTNHCIHASVVISLDSKGFEAFHIMATTRHKCERSIKSYVSRCPEKKKKRSFRCFSIEFN